METRNGWKVRRESDYKRVERGWRVCRGQMCDGAGWKCGVRIQGTARVRARDAPTRGTVTWVLSRDTATEYSHRVLS